MVESDYDPGREPRERLAEERDAVRRERDMYRRERDAALARAETAERERGEARDEAKRLRVELSECLDREREAIARVEAAERALRGVVRRVTKLGALRPDNVMHVSAGPWWEKCVAAWDAVDDFLARHAKEDKP